MSTKQRCSKPPVNWPALPPEIWTLIFRHATLVPDLISPDLCNYDKRDPIMRRQKKLFKQSLVTRRYLIRVCKAWYSSAVCFLYESILLGRGRSLAALCEALKRSHRVSTGTPLEELPLGRWTKRIDVAMRDSTDDPNGDMALVGDIVAMLPNLSIIIFDITGNRYSMNQQVRDIPGSILQSTPVGTLNVVYCHNHMAPAKDWFEFLNLRPHLRSINNTALRNFTAKPLRFPQFPSLTSLYLLHSWTAHLYVPSELPNLRHLTYHMNHPSHNYMSREPFFRKHGTKLKSFAMNTVKPGMVDLISETCPNLASMDVTVNTWASLNAEISTLPSVNLIKLACQKLHSKRAEYAHLFGFIVRAKIMCPTLKTVQLTDERNVTGLKIHTRLLRDQLKVLSEAGVALEDAEGMVFDP